MVNFTENVTIEKLRIKVVPTDGHEPHLHLQLSNIAFARLPPKVPLLAGGSEGPIRVNPSNGISIGSVVFT